MCPNLYFSCVYVCGTRSVAHISFKMFCTLSNTYCTFHPLICSFLFLLWEKTDFHCSDKLEPQDAGISLTQWSPYLVLFRLNVTFHHSVTTYLWHSLFRYNGYKYSSGLHSNQSRQADVVCSPTHTECLREFASQKISSALLNAWVVQTWYKKVCCGDYTIEKMCAYQSLFSTEPILFIISFKNAMYFTF